MDPAGDHRRQGGQQLPQPLRAQPPIHCFARRPRCAAALRSRGRLRRGDVDDSPKKRSWPVQHRAAGLCPADKTRERDESPNREAPVLDDEAGHHDLVGAALAGVRLSPQPARLRATRGSFRQHVCKTNSAFNSASRPEKRCWRCGRNIAGRKVDVRTREIHIRLKLLATSCASRWLARTCKRREGVFLPRTARRGVAGRWGGRWS